MAGSTVDWADTVSDQPANVVQLKKRGVTVDPDAEQVVKPKPKVLVVDSGQKLREEGPTRVAGWAKRVHDQLPKSMWAPDRYTDEERVEGVRIALEKSVAEAAEAVGAPRQTVRDWIRDAGIDYTPVYDEVTARRVEVANAAQAAARAELRTLLVESAVKVLKRLDRETIDFRGKDARKVTFPEAPARDARDLAIAAAILLDKYRLEAGEATDRVETRDITDQFDDDEKRRLRDVIDSVLEGAGPGEAARVAVEVGTPVRE